ncbi:MAG: hypothetical protein IKF78_04700 [Atopobiaceae bacterium]|nr:hypothetical protein [Atopobiaceae bacterium]
MRISYYDAYQVLLLQAADNGRKEALFGPSFERARTLAEPYVIGQKFPSVYLEFPLYGDPFLDVTFLYNELEEDDRIDAPTAGNIDDLLSWWKTLDQNEDGERISFGFELDTKEEVERDAAIHFQPRGNLELVKPFFEAIGEPERATTFLDQAAKMPAEWQLSFFGLFRGRPNTGLRVCGYLSAAEMAACANDKARVRAAFDQAGFTAYDDALLNDVTRLLGIPSILGDFQFDVLPGGELGTTFALDIQFGIEQPEEVTKNFADGPASRIMRLLNEWGIADERAMLVPQATFARSLPMGRTDGSVEPYSFVLMPQWVKVRWCDGKLQPAKMYFLASAGFSD